MVIKKSDILRFGNTNLEQEVKTLEAEIDKTLKEQFQHRQFAYYKLKAGTSDKALTKSLENYKLAGWTVKYKFEKDIGSCLLFM